LPRRPLHPTPLSLPDAAPALRLTALVLDAHSPTETEHSTDMGILTSLCEHSPQRTRELLDRLVTTGTLKTWHHNRQTDEGFWQLQPQPQKTNSCLHTAPLARRTASPEA
jgi:hypothetical protein